MMYLKLKEVSKEFVVESTRNRQFLSYNEKTDDWFITRGGRAGRTYKENIRFYIIGEN